MAEVATVVTELLLDFCLISMCTGGAVVEKIARRETSIAPLSITPSQDWDGNDGSWSTFSVQIGTPPQPIKVLISTASSQVWAVAPEGCQSGDPVDCPKLRGGLYHSNLSSTYATNLKNTSTNIYALGLETALGYTGQQYVGRYGFDDVTLGISGTNGPTLRNQTIAEIGLKPFYLGFLGLNPASTNLTDETDPLQSYLFNLRNDSKVPSLSWAYTAGNQYRLGDVLGSLTLGGYDKSKFVANPLLFNISTSDYGYLGIELKSIGSGTTNLLPDGSIPSFLDSTLPYIYLPLSACTAFESTFGLIWNDTSQLYTINNTQHLLVQSQNPTVTFTLGIPNSTDSRTLTITFPYAAFDLTATYPLAVPDTKFFPLRRATDPSQYLLGRAFFQEAYVITDWERGTFSVSQCSWDSSSKIPDLVTIEPLDSSSSKSTFGIDAIAGIATAGAVVVLLLAIWFFWWRPRKRRRRQATVELATTEAALAGAHIDPYAKPELDSSEISTRISEADGSSAMSNAGSVAKFYHRHELVGDERMTTVYEMPVNEEVAVEMAEYNEKPAKEGNTQRQNRRSTLGNGWWSGVFGGRRPKRSGSESTTLSSGWGSRQATPSGAYVTLAKRDSTKHETEPRQNGGRQDRDVDSPSSMYSTPNSAGATEQTQQASFVARVHQADTAYEPGSGTLSSISSG